MFPCFHCFNKTTPSHKIKLFHFLFFRGRSKWNVTKLSHVQDVNETSMLTLNQYGVELVKDHLTALSEVIRLCKED